MQCRPMLMYMYSYTDVLLGCSESVCLCGTKWNLSNPDTLGPEESVLISEVSSFQGL